MLDLVTLDVYPWGTSSYTRYEDDGESLDYRTGEFCLTRYECVESDGTVTFTVEARSGTFLPPDRDYRVVLHGRTSAPTEVTLNGEPLDEVTPVELEAGATGWAWDAVAETLTARFPDSGSELLLITR